MVPTQATRTNPPSGPVRPIAVPVSIQSDDARRRAEPSRRRFAGRRTDHRPGHHRALPPGFSGRPERRHSARRGAPRQHCRRATRAAVGLRTPHRRGAARRGVGPVRRRRRRRWLGGAEYRTHAGHPDRSGHPDRGGSAGPDQHRGQARGRRTRLVVPAGPVVHRHLLDRRQCRDQRGRPVLREVRRHG